MIVTAAWLTNDKGALSSGGAGGADLPDGRPFTRQDRSRFLGALDTAIQAIRRSGV